MSALRRFVGWLAVPLHLMLALAALAPLTVLVRYMWYNGRNVPRFDQWRGFNVVYAADAGTLTLADLMQPVGEQITFFSHLQTAIFTVMTDWNLWAEMWVNLLLGLVAFGLYVFLMARIGRGALVLALVPFSLLVFMVRQDANWTNGYMSQWWFAQVWWLAALAVLAANPSRRWAVVLAAAFGFCATISQAVGNVTWAAGLVYLLLRRDRDPVAIAIWLAAAGLAVGFYAANTPESVSVIGGAGLQTFALAVIYALAQVGVVFEAFPNVAFLVVLGGGGLLLLVANAVALLRDGEREAVALWGSVAAYGIGAAYLVGLGRIEQDGFERLFFTWYTTAVLPFWLALVALAAMVCWRVVVEKQRELSRRVLLYANIVAAGVLLAAYVPSNQNGLDKLLATQWRGVQESCIMRYIFVQGDIPFCYLQDPDLYQYNQLAARRLALYATREPESILHAGAADSDPVFIETHTPWLNTHIRDYFLYGVDRSRLVHAYPPMPEALAAIPEPPLNAFTVTSESVVDDLLSTLGKAESFWYVRREDHETAIPAFWEALRARGYFVLDTRTRNDGMLVSRVQYVPDDLENSPRFGENIRLRAVTDVSDAVMPCEDIRLNTFWTVEGAIPLDYSGSLRLLDANGVKVAQSDAGLGVLSSSAWQPGERYADVRTLAVPCDLPPGTYRLTMGVYFYQTPGEFLATDGGAREGIEPDTVLIREIQVGEVNPNGQN